MAALIVLALMAGVMCFVGTDASETPLPPSETAASNGQDRDPSQSARDGRSQDRQTLEPTADTVVIRVVCAVTGSPLRARFEDSDGRLGRAGGAGEFVVPPTWSRTGEVFVRHEGYVEVGVVPSRWNEQTLSLTPHAVVEIRVVDERAHGVADAQIWFADGEASDEWRRRPDGLGALRRLTTCDSAGTCHVRVGRSMLVQARSDDAASEAVRITAESSRVRLTVTTCRRIRFVDEAARPLVGVEVYYQSNARTTVHGHGVTDQDGALRIPPGPAAIEVPGYVAVSASPNDLGRSAVRFGRVLVRDRGSEELTVILRSRPRMHVRVVDGDSRRPISGASFVFADVPPVSVGAPYVRIPLASFESSPGEYSLPPTDQYGRTGGMIWVCAARYAPRRFSPSELHAADSGTIVLEAMAFESRVELDATWPDRQYSVTVHHERSGLELAEIPPSRHWAEIPRLADALEVRCNGVLVESEVRWEGAGAVVTRPGLARLSVVGEATTTIHLDCVHEHGAVFSGVLRGSRIEFDSLPPGTYRLASSATIGLIRAGYVDAGRDEITLVGDEHRTIDLASLGRGPRSARGRVAIRGADPGAGSLFARPVFFEVKGPERSDWRPRFFISSTGEYSIPAQSEGIRFVDIGVVPPDGIEHVLARVEPGADAEIHVRSIRCVVTGARPEREYTASARWRVADHSPTESFCSAYGPGESLLPFVPTSVGVVSFLVDGKTYARPVVVDSGVATATLELKN